MTLLLALAPCIAVFVTVFVLRFSSPHAAASAAIVTLLLWSGSAFGPVVEGALGRAISDTVLLILIVASVLIPGLVFVEVTARQKTQQAIIERFQSLALAPAQAATLISIGVGVFIESLTGMGVSLLVTMPLLLGLTDRRKAIGIGLVGMGLMPWGALALPSVLGAKLAGIDEVEFGRAAFLTSSPIVLALPFMTRLLLRTRDQPEQSLSLLPPSVVGGILLVVMGCTTWVLGVEIAGVLGGLAVSCAFVLSSPGTLSRARIDIVGGVRPYAILIFAVVLQKLVVYFLNTYNISVSLSAARVTWSALSTPGFALMAAAALTSRATFDVVLLKSVATRAWRPVVATVLFLLSARVLVEIGGTEALANAATGLPKVPALMSVAAFGAISGFLTGSGISGNALFMPSAAKIGAAFQDPLLFAAVQNAAAGHAALASLPIGSVLLATLPNRTKDDDRTALIYGLRLAGLSIFILMIWSLILSVAR